MHQRRYRHAERNRGDKDLSGLMPQDIGRHRGAKYDKSKFPALRQQQARTQCRFLVLPNRQAEQTGDEALSDDEGAHHKQDIQPTGSDKRQIDRHADDNEEKPDQDAAERSDIRFNLMAVLGFRQQQPCHESPQRHGKAAKGDGPAGSQNDEQRRGDKLFRTAGSGDQPIERAQYQPADNNYGEYRTSGLHG